MSGRGEAREGEREKVGRIAYKGEGSESKR